MRGSLSSSSWSKPHVGVGVEVEGRLGLGTGMGIGMRGPTTASGEKRCVPRSEEEVALVSFEDAEISAEEEEELDVEKSIRRACGEGVGGEEEESGNVEVRAGWRVGTPRDLLLLCGYDLDLENLNGLRGERIGGGFVEKVGRISKLEERESKLSFPTLEEPANTPTRGLSISAGLDLIEVGRSSIPRRPLAPLPLPLSQL